MPSRSSSRKAQNESKSASAHEAKNSAPTVTNAGYVSGAATGLADVVSQGALQGVAMDKATDLKNILRYMQRCRHESANAAAANQVLESMKPEKQRCDRLRRVLESRQAAAKAKVRNMEEREGRLVFHVTLAPKQLVGMTLYCSLMIRAAPLLFVCVCVLPCSAQVALESEAQAEEQSESESDAASSAEEEVKTLEHDAERILAETDDQYKVLWQGYEAAWEAWRIEGEVGTPIATWEPKANLEGTIALEAWKARPAEVKKREGVRSALAQAEAASEVTQALLQTPGPTTAALKATQARAEGAAGQIAKWTSNMQRVFNRWERYLLVHQG